MLKLPLEWLKDYVAIKDAPEQLAERLTIAGFEVTGIAQHDGQPVFDLEITPNRADCLSIVGMAREVAAMTGQRLKVPGAASATKAAGGEGRTKPRARPASDVPRLTIRIEDRAGCQRYIGRVIEGVRVGPSPEWMQRRLAACGIRAISNVVDATNYVLLELGQPLHAFDYDTVAEQTIVVRRARDGERLATLDGETRTLAASMLVIAGAKRPIAVAGVMGGRDTQVTERTTRILLESAWFDPIVVRRTGRALGLSSESSYRFERGVDPGGVKAASQRAASLIVELSGGQLVAEAEAGYAAPRPKPVTVALSRIERLLGAPVSSSTATRLLSPLGFSIRATKRQLVVGPPTFRRDVKHEVDVIEEIARRIGYDQLPKTIPAASIGVTAPEGESTFDFERQARALCVGLGLSEVMTWSLLSEADLARIAPRGANVAALPLANPLTRDHAWLRPTLLPDMLAAVARNLAQGIQAIRLFELGHIFEADGARETTAIGVALCGAWERNWQGAQRSDLFRLKGLVEQLVDRAAGAPLDVSASTGAWIEPGRGIAVAIRGAHVGMLGEVSRRVREAFDCAEPVWFAQLSVPALRSAQRDSRGVELPSLLPPVKRDMSWIVDRRVPVGELLGVIRAVGAPLASHVELTDRYTGSQLPKDKHSVTVAIQYRDPSRTLTAAEVDVVHQRIGQALIERFSAQLRA